jgi:uncharacterized protein YdeI (BOF family)
VKQVKSYLMVLAIIVGLFSVPSLAQQKSSGKKAAQKSQLKANVPSGKAAAAMSVAPAKKSALLQ